MEASPKPSLETQTSSVAQKHQRSIKVAHNTHPRSATGSPGSYNSPRDLSPTASARTEYVKSPSKLSAEIERPTEESSVESISLGDGISSDPGNDILSDNGPALRKDLWPRHPTIGNDQSTQLGGIVDGAEAEELDVGKDNTEAKASSGTGVHSQELQVAIQPKNIEYQPSLMSRPKSARMRNVHGASFIPLDELYKLITPESLSKELQNTIQRFGFRVPFTRAIQYVANDSDVCGPIHTQEEGKTTENESKRIKFAILCETIDRFHHHGRELHGDDMYGINGDMSPENIPWFKRTDDHDFEHYGDGLSTPKIADFSLSDINYSTDSSGVGAYTHAYRPSKANTVDKMSGIFELGIILLEIALEMSLPVRADRDGVEERPDHSSFTLEKGIMTLKPTVSDWMRALNEDKNSPPLIRDLLAVICASVLTVNPETRMDAAKLAQILNQMQDWGRSHPGYFLPGAADDESLRMILYPGSIENDEQESVQSVERSQERKQTIGHQEKIQAPEAIAEAPPTTIQLNGMKLVPCSEVDHPLSLLDKFRLWLECYLDDEIDWWPLRPLKPMPEWQHTQLRWEYGGEEMAITLNQSETEWLSISQNQAMGETHLMDTLPIAQPRSHQLNDAQTSSSPKPGKPFWDTWIQYINRLLDNGKPNTPGSGDRTGGTHMETYLCVDKCWTAIKDTRMRTVAAVEDMKSDYEFFCRIRNLLNQVEGNWLQRKLSWRSYTSVELSRFHFLWDDTDEVEVDGKPPPIHKKTFQGYQYTPIQGLPIHKHMEICAKILLLGIENPERGRGERGLLDSMPKMLAPPGLDKKQFSGGWGFHARQSLCMWQMMWWIGAVLAFGIAFVPYWLCAIDKLDLQTALAPASFLATVLGIGLAMLAIAHTR